jgi:hypothetical protein
MAGDLSSLVMDLESAGVFQYLLPFLLVFTIIFAVLEKTALFGRDNEQNTKTGINAVVGLIIGLLVITQWDVVDKMNLFLPKMSLIVVMFVMVLILIGTMGVDITHGPRGIFALIMGAGALIGIYWALSRDFNLEMPYWITNNQSTIFLVAFVAVVLWALIAGSRPRRAAGGADAFERMGNFFGLGGGHH